MFTRNYSAFTSGSSPILEGRKFVEPLRHVIYTGLYTVILRLFSSIRRFLTTPEQSSAEDPQRSVPSRQLKLSSWRGKKERKREREREGQKLHAIVSTAKTKLHGSICFVSQPISPLCLESLYITFYGNLLTWSEDKLGRNRSVETVCNPRGLRSVEICKYPKIDKSFCSNCLS